VHVRILIADDNASVRNAMRQVLEAEHWEIIEADNGQDAVTKAVRLRPNLVILDLVMPLVNGLTAAREIALLLPGVPILMHTLYSNPEVNLKAENVGVRMVVPKSESSALISAVQEILQSELPADAPSRSAPVSAVSVTAKRRTEDRIRELCGQLFGTNDDAEHARLLTELQDALHRHIEHFRARIAEYPLVAERRVRGEIPMLIPAQESTDKGSPQLG
jgi:DNA-binding NarL/FixJ family response regulator